MIKKKLIIVILLVTFFTIYSFLNYNNSALEYTSQLNFYITEYEEEYSNYEKELVLNNSNKEIIVSGTTTSGEIDVKIVVYDNEIILEEFIFNVDEYLEESINLEGKTNHKWVYFIDIYEDTEGTISVGVI